MGSATVETVVSETWSDAILWIARATDVSRSRLRFVLRLLLYLVDLHRRLVAYLRLNLLDEQVLRFLCGESRQLLELCELCGLELFKLRLPRLAVSYLFTVVFLGFFAGLNLFVESFLFLNSSLLETVDFFSSLFGFSFSFVFVAYYFFLGFDESFLFLRLSGFLSLIDYSLRLAFCGFDFVRTDLFSVIDDKNENDSGKYNTGEKCSCSNNPTQNKHLL